MRAVIERFSNFNWDDLKYFLVVARSGSLRGGAEAIGANHVTVSRRLTALEAALEGRLFDRTRGGQKLTQLGEELLPAALRIEEEIAAASRIVAGRDTRPYGPIYLSMPPFMAMTSIVEDLAEFGRQFAGIDIHLEVSNDFANLGRREADVSIRYTHEVSDDVVGRRVLRCASAIYCSVEYARGMIDNGGKGLNWIGWNEDEGQATAGWVKKSPFPHARLRHRVHEGVPQLALAAAGAGMTMVPCFAGDRFPGLVRAPFQTPVLDRSIWLLLHSDLRKTARIRMFVDFLVDRLRQRRAEFTAESAS